MYLYRTVRRWSITRRSVETRSLRQRLSWSPLQTRTHSPGLWPSNGENNRRRRCDIAAVWRAPPPLQPRLCKALPERLPTIRRRQDLRVDHRTTESQPDGSTKSTQLSLPARPSSLEEEGLILSLPLPLFPPLYSVWLAQLACHYGSNILQYSL